MRASIGLGDDFDGASLRRLARTSKSANQARRQPDIGGADRRCWLADCA